MTRRDRGAGLLGRTIERASHLAGLASSYCAASTPADPSTLVWHAHLIGEVLTRADQQVLLADDIDAGAVVETETLFRLQSFGCFDDDLTITAFGLLVALHLRAGPPARSEAAARRWTKTAA